MSEPAYLLPALPLYVWIGFRLWRFFEQGNPCPPCLLITLIAMVLAWPVAFLFYLWRGWEPRP